MSKAVTWKEVDAVPGWRESLRQKWYDLAGLTPRKTQQTDNWDRNTSQMSARLKEK
jgi:hypothetical protein